MGKLVAFIKPCTFYPIKLIFKNWLVFGLDKPLYKFPANDKNLIYKGFYYFKI